MKRRWIPACTAGLMVFAAMRAVASPAQIPRTGGYTTVSTTNQAVVAAAAFAVKAHAEALRENADGTPAAVELVGVLAAAQQVVAGMNYRLTLKVKLNGKEKTAEAVVWWQAWRRPDPYQLTSWRWK